MTSYEVRDCITQLFRPSCIVFSSPGAKKIFKQNNLSPAEFLRPFADLRKEQLIININEKSFTSLKDLMVDFFDSSDYDSPSMQIRQKFYKEIIHLNSPQFIFNPVHNLISIGTTNYLRKLTSNTNTLVRCLETDFP